MIGSVLLSFLVFLSPLVAMAFYKICKLQRETTKAEQNPRPFESAPQPNPLALLSNLTFTQRLYLKQQIKTAATIFVFGAWVFTFILAIPIFIAPHGEKWFNKSALIWFEFLRNSSSSLQFLSMALFLAIVPLRFGAEARFYRTRPLTIGFLFWSRVLLIVLALILAAGVGIAVATGLLCVIKGPVWQNLPALIPRTLGPDDADIAEEYAGLLVTSAPRMLLSLLTTMILFFTALLALVTAPVIRLRQSSSPFVPVRILLYASPLLIALPMLRLVSFHLPAILFVYVSFGPPPPYRFALLPIFLSVAFIFLARLFANRIEV
jgi:hypothetical protein